MSAFSSLRAVCGARFREHEPLAKHLYIKIGGPARYFVEVQTADEVVLAVREANEAGVPWFAFGGGSNMVVADEGWNGLAIKFANREVVIEGDCVTAGAGALSVLVARKAAEAGLRGFEWAITLPGTIGGAVRGNAGCFGGEMKDVVEKVTVLRQGQMMELSNADGHFNYRQSLFKEEGNEDVIWSVMLKLTPGDAAEALAQLNEIMAKRKATQPLGTSSAGCMFKNIHRDGVVLHAGKLIDEAGLKGYRAGGAQISEVHGNFVLNVDHATASDIRALVAHAQSVVAERTGEHLEPEVQFYGFEKRW